MGGGWMGFLLSVCAFASKSGFLVCKARIIVLLIWFLEINIV